MNCPICQTELLLDHKTDDANYYACLNKNCRNYRLAFVVENGRAENAVPAQIKPYGEGNNS